MRLARAGSPAATGGSRLRHLIPFAARMAWRETRTGWRHFTVFLTSIALGVAALVGVQGFAQSLGHTLAREAKTLMGGDLEVRSPGPLDPAVAARVEALAGPDRTVARVRELEGMARGPGGGTLLVEMKGVDAAYPLYGRVALDPPRPEWPRALAAGEVLVEPALARRLGLTVGDSLDLGAARFTVAGLVEREPDRPAGAFILGPRVLLSAEGLDRTRLIRPGSRVRYRLLLRLPEGSDPAALRRALAQEVADPAVRVASFEDAQPGLRRFFDQLTQYLRLVGLTSLLVGGIGVAAAVRTFLQKRLVTIAILKCLGANARTLVTAYLGQALVLGVAGSVAGALLGLGVQALLRPLLARFVPFEVALALPPLAVARGLALGVLTTLLCALWPLLAVREVPVALLLRHPVEPSRPRGRRPWLAGLAIAGCLAALVVWQAGSRRVGALFVAAVLVALSAMAGSAAGVRRLAPRLPRPRSLAWRRGLANLARPGGQTTGVVVALGVGVMLLSAIAVIERALTRQFDHESRREAPSFFFLDLQPDQVERFTALVAGSADGAGPTVLTPVARSRLVAINGEPIVRAKWHGHPEAWRVSREYVLTAAAQLPAGNEVTRGRWWTGRPASGGPRISVEEDAARGLGVDIGGTLTFDVQGLTLTATIDSLRKVDWRSFSMNFFVIFAPGALDEAPLTYVATARLAPARESAVQDAVAAALPNVTAIPVRDVLERVTTIVREIALAVRLVGLFVVGAGVTVMAGALLATRAQRLYESVVLRTLGATRGEVLRGFAVEYACLGLQAGLGGSALGGLLAWAVLRFVLDSREAVSPHALGLGVLTGVSLALAVGLLGTFRLLGQKPLPVLRRE